MKPDELDRILLSEKQIEPATSFTANVMARVEMAAAETPGIPFPWMRLAALLLAVVIPSTLFSRANAFMSAMNSLSNDLGRWILAPSSLTTGNAYFIASVSLLGTWLLVWFSLRLAGANR